jgi:hypothetical protein
MLRITLFIPYDTAGITATCIGLQFTIRANFSLTLTTPEKKSTGLMEMGFRFRRIPSIPLSSTDFRSGDIYAQFR